MQQVQAFFGGGRSSTEPDSSILAEWNKCAYNCRRYVQEVASVHTANALLKYSSVSCSVSTPCYAPSKQHGTADCCPGPDSYIYCSVFTCNGHQSCFSTQINDTSGPPRRRYETSSAPPTQSDRLMGQMEAGGATLTNAFSNSIVAAREGTAGIAGVLGSGGFGGATSLCV